MGMIKVGMKFQSLTDEEKFGTVTKVTKKEVVLDVNGEEVKVVATELHKEWQAYLSAPIEPTAGETKANEKQPEQADADMDTLKLMYETLTAFCKNQKDVEVKVNNNGTTVCKYLGKGNFSEIRLQRTKLAMRVLQEIPADTVNLDLKVIPDTYGWTYKTEIKIKKTDDIELLISLLKGSMEHKLK